jgi:hypothetical protein
MAGRKFETEKGTFEVVSAAVRGQKGMALMDLELKGRIDGRLTLKGRPVFDPVSGTLRLEDLDFVLDSGMFTRFGVWLYKSSLRKLLAEKASWFMDKSLTDLKGTIQKGLTRTLAPGLSLEGTLSGLTLEQPRILEDRFQLDAVLDGKVGLTFRGN